MKIDPDLKGSFVNWREGVGYDLEFLHYRCGFLGGQTPIFAFHLNREHPLMFRQGDGTLLMTPERFPTDGGTVKPTQAQYWIPKDRFMPGFLFHDSIYQTGGLWAKRPGHLWEWVELSRSETDALLMTFCLCDPVPCGWWKAHIVWSGVRVGGWWGWSGKELYGSNPNEWAEKPDCDPSGGYGGG